MKQRLMKKYHGLTLIEVLVALLIFAILASITSSLLYHAFDTQARVTKQTNQLNALQLAIAIIERDSAQLVLQHAGATTFIGHPTYLQFTRGGVVNPNGQEARTTLQRIQLRCEKHQLIRQSARIADLTNKTLPLINKVLLSHVEKCQFAYLNSGLQRLPVWNNSTEAQRQLHESVPKAIQLVITIKNWGNLSYLFTLPGLRDVNN